MVGSAMTEVQDILFGIAGQTVYFDAPEGRPSSVTSVEVFADENADTSPGESAITGVGSVESISTTFANPSGPAQDDPYKLHLTSVTGLVRSTPANRRWYWATATDGAREQVEVARIESAGNHGYARNQLTQEYVAGNTFASPRITATVATAWASDVGKLSDPLSPNPKYRVRWVYVVGGVTYVGVSWFDLVRYSSLSTVTPMDVERRFAGWLHRLPTDERLEQGQRIIREAQREVGMRLLELGKGLTPQRNSPALNELVLYMARLIAHEQQYDGGADNAAQVERAEREFDRRFGLFREPKVMQQVTSDGAGAPSPQAPLMRR
jgi:hypothetical protein